MCRKGLQAWTAANFLQLCGIGIVIPLKSCCTSSVVMSSTVSMLSLEQVSNQIIAVIGEQVLDWLRAICLVIQRNFKIAIEYGVIGKKLFAQRRFIW